MLVYIIMIYVKIKSNYIIILHTMCFVLWHIATDRGSVQLGPRDVHSCLSSSLRLSCSSETAELVRAGLDTEAPIAGPPVVFTIYR